MELLLQYRTRWMGVLLTLATFAILLIFHRSGNSVFGLYLLLAVPLQFCFSARWLWGAIIPAIILALMLMIVTFQLATGFTDLYVAAYGLMPVLLFITVLINVGVNSWHRVKLRQFAKQVNESGMTETLYISDNELTKSGLDNSERTFFKREVRNAYHQLEYLREIRREVIKYIPTYDSDLRFIEQTFQELLSAPRQLLNISDFMYNDLPDYVALSQGLVRVNNNLVSSENTQQAVQKAQAKLSKLSDKLQHDYVLITTHEVDELNSRAGE
ncbi:hypothetical protein HC026_11680 [Lactobacillus sp. LC28-10]|uniref:5-bromo-4-chloroindolyl phosphate hydrolase n=1 Tax=Secundilactobacillus angelensis TaxID=2722706 RepID=A0ABX1L0Z6_9LACO|nr:5-bromo-4-chloroindolyl phosphate hydrolysis family protein [Secundilactobacillus angelensis]MCH5463158.1 5-bromo-4-chloroindolyl phosphate hydrolysis family protein [Secundilactobacillus angelensis]NLR19549.1 hypothetical protein [Secundilactobacillus angelensis]